MLIHSVSYVQLVILITIMKNVLLFLFFVPFLAMSQESGTISYEMTTKVDLGARGARMPKEIRDRIPKERKANKELVFNKTESIYKTGKQTQPDEAAGDGFGGRRFRRRFMGGGPDRETYKNISSAQIVDKNEFMDKTFLIKGEMPEYKWKITGAKKKILDYLAMEATTMVDDTIQVTAWFTPQIAISNGPQDFHGLPGMILALDRDNGKMTIVATEVVFAALEKDAITKPKKGKEVTQEEFSEIRREKSKEMRGRRGGRDGAVRIRRG